MCHAMSVIRGSRDFTDMGPAQTPLLAGQLDDHRELARTEAAQAESIRKTMQVDNLLSPVRGTPDVTTAPAVVAPSTPVKPSKDETSSSPAASPDSVMTEPVNVENPIEGTEEAMDDGIDVPDTEREFICMNDEHTRCQTGQYSKDLSRKVISDHFGRNKACTRDVTDWPLFCRKHYQRATYNKDKWQMRKVQLILRQIDVIETQFPGTMYDIAFKKSEESRLNQFSRQVASGMSTEEAEKNTAPVVGKHFEAPIDVLRELDQWLGRAKTYEDVKKVVDVILQMLEEKECEQVPAIEFLPKLPGKVKKTPVKARPSPKTPKAPKTPSYISPKGSVKKSNRKA
ncbi:ORP1 like [Pyrenophora seminiperda CCB06]|uniref:ORP1 like n=1 Tax=Pyrenophora seminiperda CCB06 TaxID=1302712 RepID=A0A3M7MGX6_9PLEO|nr:ORP1 like [Pyrenophora seminiperda CCB06]